jgi:hypothetical protein
VHTTCLVLGESNFCVSVIKTLQNLLFMNGQHIYCGWTGVV